MEQYLLSFFTPKARTLLITYCVDCIETALFVLMAFLKAWLFLVQCKTLAWYPFVVILISQGMLLFLRKMLEAPVLCGPPRFWNFVFNAFNHVGIMRDVWTSLLKAVSSAAEKVKTRKTVGMSPHIFNSNSRDECTTARFRLLWWGLKLKIIFIKK